VVLLFHRHVHEVVDALGDKLLVLQGLLEHGEQRSVFGRRHGNGFKLGMLPLAVDIVVEFHGMGHFLLVLDHEPVSRTLQADVGGKGRHCEIKVG